MELKMVNDKWNCVCWRHSKRSQFRIDTSWCDQWYLWILKLIFICLIHTCVAFLRKITHNILFCLTHFLFYLLLLCSFWFFCVVHSFSRSSCFSWYVFFFEINMSKMISWILISKKSAERDWDTRCFIEVPRFMKKKAERVFMMLWKIHWIFHFITTNRNNQYIVIFWRSHLSVTQLPKHNTSAWLDLLHVWFVFFLATFNYAHTAQSCVTISWTKHIPVANDNHRIPFDIFV